MPQIVIIAECDVFSLSMSNSEIPRYRRPSPRRTGQVLCTQVLQTRYEIGDILIMAVGYDEQLERRIALSEDRLNRLHKIRQALVGWNDDGY
jgi:hypothetical protein